MLTTLLAAVINFAICLLLINSIGLWAAIVGTLVSYFIMAITRMIDTLRYIKFEIDIIRFALNSAIIIVEAILVSFEIQIYLSALAALLLFVVVNFGFVKKLLKKEIKNA